MAKTIYTYDDFLKQAASAGLLQSFSAADLKLALQNPDAGMTLLTYKQDYRNAASDEARALANAGAEKVRADYGGYSAGPDGTGFRVLGADVTNKNYVNQYVDEQQALAEFIQKGFDEKTAEALWGDYRKAYLREGQRAYENSLGEAASNTGGIASTAAVTAAQQAQNYYSAQAADKKAELYQQLYENYLAERGQAVDELLAYDQLTQTAMDRYRQENPAYGDSAGNHATVSRGSTGKDVTALQTYLIHLGYSCGDNGADGVFGSGTRAAVRAFQRDHGLAVDGIAGRKTWAALFEALGA